MFIADTYIKTSNKLLNILHISIAFRILSDEYNIFEVC